MSEASSLLKHLCPPPLVPTSTYLAYNLFDSEYRQMLSDFRRNGAYFYTNSSLTVSSTFYLEILFSGKYEYGCWLNFNIVGNDEYHYIFSIFMILHTDNTEFSDTNYRDLYQTSSSKRGIYEKKIKTRVPALGRVNKVYILITEDNYEVTINNVVVTPKFPIDRERLHNYRGLKIYQHGTCLSIDIGQSYMANGGKSASPSLVIPIFYNVLT